MDSFYVRLDALDDLGNNRLPAIRDSLTNALGELKIGVEWIRRTFDVDLQSWFHLFEQPGRECYIATDFMQQIFQDNAENVDLAAQAIREIALRYRQVDGQA